MDASRMHEREREREVSPVLVDYICEHCNEGTMKVDLSKPVTLPLNLPDERPFQNHICVVCKGEMLLPKSYPYIKWVPKEPQ